jgi:hypothetical protein
MHGTINHKPLSLSLSCNNSKVWQTVSVPLALNTRRTCFLACQSSLLCKELGFQRVIDFGWTGLKYAETGFLSGKGLNTGDGCKDDLCGRWMNVSGC